MTLDADVAKLTVQDVWPSCPEQTRHTHLMISATGASLATLTKERSVLELIRETQEFHDWVRRQALFELVVASLPEKAA